MTTKEQFEAEAKEILRYKPPNAHRIKTKRRIVQVENWIARNGMVQENDVIAYIIRAFDLDRKKAILMFAEVKTDFERLGRVYG